ncbi:hypothetical protein RB595_007918 [Gaeumannomyces hyphopodioides]
MESTEHEPNSWGSQTDALLQADSRHDDHDHDNSDKNRYECIRSIETGRSRQAAAGPGGKVPGRRAGPARGGQLPQRAPSRAKLVATLKVAAKTTWRKRRLENLERKLRDAEGLLQTGLLTRIYERSERNGVGIAALDANLRSFLDEYRKGKADAAALVSAQALRTREHITTETKGSVDAIKTHITQETTQAEGSLKTHITQTTTQMEASLKGHIAVAIGGATECEQDARQEARGERLLRSLKFDSMNERSNQVLPSHAGTLEWVLKDGSNGEGPESSGSETESWDSFSDWLRSTEPKYWISGKPGSGKTTLMKYLAKHGRTRNFLDIWSPGAVLISHFFWRPGTQMQQSIKGLLCSLLYQLFTMDKASLDRMLRDSPGISMPMISAFSKTYRLISLWTVPMHERCALV